MSLQDFARELSCGRPSCDCMRRTPGKALLHCPAHHDRTPSLSVRERGGGIVWTCFTGCERRAVTDALRARGLLPRAAPRGRNTEGGSEPSAYQRERHRRIMAAAVNSALSWQAAEWMLYGFEEEQQRRRAEWDQLRREVAS